MEIRIRPATDDSADLATSRDGRTRVVIADAGTSAEVLVFSSDEPVATGTEFCYRGTTWVVTGTRRDSGILVAEPAAH